jgi:hypothetical protein
MEVVVVELMSEAPTGILHELSCQWLEVDS